MKEPLVIRKMRVLNRKELQSLRRELGKLSINPDLLDLATKVLDLIWHTPSETISFERIFQDSAFGSSKQNVLLNKLHELLKNFIVNQLSVNDLQEKVNFEMKLLQFFNDRRADDFVISSGLRVEDMLRSYGYEDDFYFYNNLRLAEERTLLYYRSNAEKRHLQEQSDAADLFYLSKKLAFCAGMVNAGNINKTKFDYHMMEEVLGHLEKRPYENVPTIYLWASALRLLLNPKNRDNFEKLEKGLYENIDLITPFTARSLFTALENSLRKMRQEYASYHEKLFEAYQFQIQREIIYINGYYPTTLFENVVTASLKVKGGEWTADFVEKNLSRISPDRKKETAAYNLARCYFEQNEYKQCLAKLKTIEKIKFKSIYINLARRVLRICAFYELFLLEADGIPNQPERAIRALKKFLHTNKAELGAAHERANLDFARFINRLTSVYGDKKIVKLRGEIEATRLLPNKQWLLDKLDSL